MRIRYQENPAIPVDELTGLYTACGWTGYTDHPDKMAKLLAGSLWAMAAYDHDLLVGLIRVVGDDCSITYVQDILVLDEYHRQGIGRHLMECMLARFEHIRQIALVTHDSEKTRGFYEALGFDLVEKTDSLSYIRYNLKR